jgi:ribulose-phosphate 3-epimerase
MSSASSSERRLGFPTLSVGVLAGGAPDLRANVALLERAGVRFVHVDVMDGRFCPPTMGGVDEVASIETSLVKDVHLMIADPIEHVADYARAGAGVISVHVETFDPAATLRAIAAASPAVDPADRVRCGLAVLPTTPTEALSPFLDLVDTLLVLGVTPGDRERDPAALDRLSRVAGLVDGRDVLVAFDGGVTADEIGTLADAGADIIVSGSAVFSAAKPPAAVLATMLEQLR